MIELDDDKARIDVSRVHGWLASSYWSPGIAREVVERAMAGSHCLGAYRDGELVGFARAITDHATFAWIADVWVDEAARGQGIGRRQQRRAERADHDDRGEYQSNDRGLPTKELVRELPRPRWACSGAECDACVSDGRGGRGRHEVGRR